MEKILRISLCVFLAQLLAPSFCIGQKIEKQAQKLKEIEEQIDRRNRELEEYMTKVEELKGQLNGIRQESEKEREKKKELESSLERTKGNISSLSEKFLALKGVYLRLLADMSGDSSRLYLQNFSISEYYGKDTIARTITLRNLILGKSALAKSVDKKSSQADREIKDLMARKERIAREKLQILVRLEKKKKELGQTQREIEQSKKRLRNLKEEIESLRNSAAELNGLIKKLEKKSPYRTNVSSYMPLDKNSLPWPVSGRVISRFGKEYVPELKTWIVRDGIRIEAEMGSPVRPVMGGTVIYCGPFRNYGSIVIVGHKENVFTTYGLLGSITVKSGDSVDSGRIIGYVGEDLQAVKGREKNSSALYFEIRKGADAFNPQVYLK